MSALLKMPGQVRFGNDCEQALQAFAAGYRKICVFTDRAVIGTKGAQKMLGALAQTGLDVFTLDELHPEPTYKQAQETVDAFLGSGADLIVAIGGGS
ncbi:MAG TPA: iron-containing alcohol dehydrogenase, partial [Candidatus Limiplasma sp.]|nr:iron-containing alcohol dehydrogenase [Candidatus Limiplasma sp.]